VLWVACGAHALHDGLTDTLYLLLPLWQAQFALSYAAIGLLRALYTGVMAGFQGTGSQAGAADGWGEDARGGTAVAAVAYLRLGASSSVALLAVALVLGGIGSSNQHPIASSLVATAYEGPRSRGALGTYNFAGDLGKMALPSITACLIAVISVALDRRTAVGVIGLLGAGAILLSLRAVTSATRGAYTHSVRTGNAPDWTRPLRNGFPLLLTIGAIDSATRMGFLTFLPCSVAIKRGRALGDRARLDNDLRRRRGRQLVCGFLGGTARGIADRAPDRRSHSRRHIGSSPAANRRGAGAAAGYRRCAQRHVIRALRHRARPCAGRPTGECFGVFYTGTIGGRGIITRSIRTVQAMRSALPRRCCLSPRSF